jgi:hypothetical protein
MREIRHLKHPSSRLFPASEREGEGVYVRVGHKPSSVPMPRASVMIIPLGRELPHASSDLPGSLGRATLKRSPIWSCSGWGLPSRPGCPYRWWSLTPPFHPCLCRDTSGSYEPDVQAIGGLLSVALSVGSPRLGVTQQPALWSSDFPQAPIHEPAII